MSEHAYSAVAEYVSVDWIRKEIPVRLDGDWAHYLEGFRRADLEWASPSEQIIALMAIARGADKF